VGPRTKRFVPRDLSLPAVCPDIRLPRDLVELLRTRAGQQPDAVASIYLADGEDEERRLTYGALDRRSRALAALLQAYGAAGERAVILMPSHIEFILAFFGVLYAGAIAVPAPMPRPNRPSPHVSAIFANSDARFVIARRKDADRLRNALAESGVALSSVILITVSDAHSVDPDLWKAPGIRGGSVAYLQYTSGSTTVPRGVVITHENVMANLAMVARSFDHRPRAPIVGWLPMYHDMGLISNVLQPLFLASTSVFTSPFAFLQRPWRWLEAISRYRGGSSGAPNFAYDLCARKVTPEQRAKLDLSCWSTAFCGSEPVRAETLRRFAETFAPCGFDPSAFYPCYGLAEATVFVAGGFNDGSHVVALDAEALERRRVERLPCDTQNAKLLVGCGAPAPGIRLRIVDPDSKRLCPPNQVGEVWISGANVAREYWNDPELSQRTFDARLPHDSARYLRTGDLGFLAGDDLFIAGRRKDMIIIDGRNIYPQDIEAAVETASPQVKPGGSVAFAASPEDGEALVIVAEMEGMRPAPVGTSDWRQRQGGSAVRETALAIRNEVSTAFDVPISAIALVAPGAVPRTTSGKARRAACRMSFLAGDIEATWSRPQAAWPGRKSETSSKTLGAADRRTNEIG
jgi:acyl-CoA synthetase (AMP-forming)/AMP-acid ligase II